MEPSKECSVSKISFIEIRKQFSAKAFNSSIEAVNSWSSQDQTERKIMEVVDFWKILLPTM